MPSKSKRARGKTPKAAPPPKGKAPPVEPKEVPATERPLSLRMQAFVHELPKDWEQKAAAIRAGYSPKTAKQLAARLMLDPRIIALVEAKQKELAERSMITAERVLEELGLIGLADMRDYVEFDPAGDMHLRLDQMPPKASRAIAEVTQKKWWEGRDDARLVTETKFKLHPKTPALNLIAQHLGMLVQRTQQLDKHGKPVDPPKEMRVILVRPTRDDG